MPWENLKRECLYHYKRRCVARRSGPIMHHQSEFDNDVLLDVEDSKIDTSFEFEGMQSSEEGDCLEESFVNERPEALACFSSPPINVPDRGFQ